MEKFFIQIDTLAAKLEDFKTRSGLSIRELAKLTECSINTIQKIRRKDNTITPRIMKKVYAYLRKVFEEAQLETGREAIKRGYCAIGVYHPKTETNIGTLIRTAHCFSADFVFTIGRRYKPQSSAIKHDRHIPIIHYLTLDDWKKSMPANAQLIAIEISDQSKNLMTFKHPERAIYLLGAEDFGIPPKLLSGITIVQIPSLYCLNVASAGSIVLYDRELKGRREWKQ